MSPRADLAATGGERPVRAGYDVAAIREDFPALHQQIHGHPLVYLDNAATTQKPRAVLDAIRDYYQRDNSNIHRGVHELSLRATRSYEAARETIQRFLNAARSSEVLFVRGTTEAVNLVAQTFGRSRVGEGDEILISHLEHHSNIVPWQMLCEEKKARLRVIPVNDRGELILEEYERLLTGRTRLVSVVHLSNSLGTINPIREMIAMAHRRGIPVMVDGAQAVSRMPVDVQELGCDFYAFSGHKIYGPTGVGALYGRSELLEPLPPYQGGGDMIASVTFEKTLYNRLPYRLEAGTPNIAGGIALGAALDYVRELGLEAIAAHERDLLEYATRAIGEVKGVRIIGTAREKAGVLSFVMDGVHPHDLGTILDQEGVAIRAGHHCTQPIMERFNLPATARASLALYNTREEMDALAAGLRKVREIFD